MKKKQKNQTHDIYCDQRNIKQNTKKKKKIVQKIYISYILKNFTIKSFQIEIKINVIATYTTTN